MSSLEQSASIEGPSLKPKDNIDTNNNATTEPQTASNSLETRYSSSAAISGGNAVKFHVAGCAYFWAVSEALLTAKDSVWILGCMPLDV
jgi:phospholipase D1/2